MVLIFICIIYLYLYAASKPLIVDIVNTVNLKLLLVFFIFSTTSMAQNESFLGLCLGAALPQGVYAEQDFYTEGAGYANTGFLFTFDGAVFPDEYLGFGMTVSYGSNNPNKTSSRMCLTVIPNWKKYWKIRFILIMEPGGI